MAVLVDTSAWIELFKPRGAEIVRRTVQEALSEGLVVSVAPVPAELLAGFQPARSVDAQAIDLLRSLPIVDLTWDGCARAGEMGRATARKGQRVPTIRGEGFARWADSEGSVASVGRGRCSS